MTLQELRYAVAVAEHLHFGRAAEACHVSQPTLSAQIRKLEETLGVTLFERSNKSVSMTLEGRRLIEQARQILARAQELEDLAASLRDPFAQPFRLGVIPTLSPYLLPWLMPAIESAYPQWKLVVREDFTADLLAQLQQHELDAAVLALPVDGGDLTAQALFREPFLVAAPKASRLARLPEISERDLAEEKLLLLTEGHCLRDQALSLCSSHKQRAAAPGDFRATSVETLRQMVAAGFGCTLLPALAVRFSSPDPRVAIKPFGDARAARTIGLVSRARFARPEPLDALAALIREKLPPEAEPLAGSSPPMPRKSPAETANRS